MIFLLQADQSSWTDITALILSFLAFIAAIFIPEKIKWEQTYSTLLSDYRSYDFAAAVQGVVDFFTIRCGNDIERIREEYESLFQKYSRKLNKSVPVSNDMNLHFQRRLLTTYFWQLNQCTKSFGSVFIGKRRIRKDFTVNEAKIAKIVFFMNKAVDESDILFKDISTTDIMPKAKNVKGINAAVASIYSILRKSKRYIY